VNFFFAPCLDIYTCEHGVLSCHQEKKENSYLKEFHSHFVLAEMKAWRLWQRRIRPRDCLELHGNDQTEPSPSQSTAGMSLVCCLYSSTKGFTLGSQV